MRPQVGQLIGDKFRLIRLIGEGGMGCVFEAKHETLGSQVALKFLNANLAGNERLVARFLQEARVSASIRSPHVVLVSDVDQTREGLPYLVMELLEGESLQSCLHRAGALPIATAIHYASQILIGLEVAHAQHVVHRDLKPDNVFIVPTAQGPLLKLLDFGIAKLQGFANENSHGLTRPGALIGTPDYMAPEQAFGANTVDARADLFSVGVILFEMIAAKRPVQAADPRAMAAMLVTGQVLRLIDVVPQVGQALSDVVARALSPDPANRYQSAMQMREALTPFASAHLASDLVALHASYECTEPISDIQAQAAVSAVAAASRNSIGQGSLVAANALSMPAPTPNIVNPLVPYASAPMQPNLESDQNLISQLSRAESINPPTGSHNGPTGTVLGGQASIPYAPAPMSSIGEFSPYSLNNEYQHAVSFDPGMQMAPMNAPAMHPPVHSSATTPASTPKRSTSAWPIVLIAIVLVCITATGVGTITWYVYRSRPSDKNLPAPIEFTPATTLTESVVQSEPSAATQPSFQNPPPSSHTPSVSTATSRPSATATNKRPAPTATSPTPPTADAGTAKPNPGSSDGDFTFPPLPTRLPPIAIPSSFPPITIPSNFPPISIPGWPPPQNQNDNNQQASP